MKPMSAAPSNSAPPWTSPLTQTRQPPFRGCTGAPEESAVEVLEVPSSLMGDILPDDIPVERRPQRAAPSTGVGFPLIRSDARHADRHETPRLRPPVPTLASRLQSLAGDGRFRSVRFRRIAAAMLVLAATALMIASQRTPEAPPLMVAATDLRPGTVLTEDHLTARPTPARLAPDGAMTSAAQVVGKRLTGPMRRGEVITDTRLLTSALPESLTGRPGSRMVPVRPADESVANLVQQGDLVDVLDAEHSVLATNAVVAMAPSIPRDGHPASAPRRSSWRWMDARRNASPPRVWAPRWH